MLLEGLLEFGCLSAEAWMESLHTGSFAAHSNHNSSSPGDKGPMQLQLLLFLPESNNRFAVTSHQQTLKEMM